MSVPTAKRSTWPEPDEAAAGRRETRPPIGTQPAGGGGLAVLNSKPWMPGLVGVNIHPLSEAGVTKRVELPTATVTLAAPPRLASKARSVPPPASTDQTSPPATMGGPGVNPVACQAVLNE